MTGSIIDGILAASDLIDSALWLNDPQKEKPRYFHITAVAPILFVAILAISYQNRLGAKIAHGTY